MTDSEQVPEPMQPAIEKRQQADRRRDSNGKLDAVAKQTGIKRREERRTQKDRRQS